MKKKGAVAAGHPITAGAARDILEAGGNAFDAVLAAFAAATVAEPVLASLGGGGFLLARPASGEARIYDFFVATPTAGTPGGEIDFYPVLADFGTATQEFHIGVGSIAVPGAIKGLFTAHADLATLPMREVLGPAIAAGHEGMRLREIDGYLFSVVGAILKATGEARAVFTRDGKETLRAGDRIRQSEVADTLEALATHGEALFYRGELADRTVELCRREGGWLTKRDLETYEVRLRRPLALAYRDARVLLNPPPSSGGLLVAFALSLLKPHRLCAETGASRGARSAADTARLLGEVMELVNEARIESGLHLAEGEAEETAAADRLLSDALLAKYRDALGQAPQSHRGTTHMSVVDEDGNMAALSLSNGEGCGRFLPGTGIMLNNMLGEEDLHPRGFHEWPRGTRIGSMMCPSLLVENHGRETVLGSGGSNRIRTAILQVVHNLLDGKRALTEAVSAPRLHVENGLLNIEGDHPAATSRALLDRWPETLQWPRHNLFFGGVHAASRLSDSGFEAAGDPRRGGDALVIE